MNSALIIAATALHLLATITVIGLYSLAFFVITPVLTREAEIGSLIAVYRRARPFVLGAWLIFILSGITLMLADSQYQGIGQFGNTWPILMLVKHLLVIGMILLSGAINCCPVIGLTKPLDLALMRQNDKEIHRLVSKLRARERAMMLLGVAVLLLTAASEAL